MTQRNVSIRSLLETSKPKDELPTLPNNSNQTLSQPPSQTPVENVSRSASGPFTPQNSVQSLISQYQTSVGFPDFSGSKSTDLAPVSAPIASQVIAPKAEPPTNILQNYVKRFQLDFQANAQSEPSLTSASPTPSSLPTAKQATAPAKLRPLKPAFKVQPATSKHSIDSIINIEETPAPKEKKRPLAKADLANKKPKTEPKKTTKAALKPEAKKNSKAKKKTPDVAPEKPAIHPTMTAEKTQTSLANVVIPEASFIEPEGDKDPASDTKGSPSTENSKNTEEEPKSKDKEKDKEKEKENEKDKGKTEKDKGKPEKETPAEVPVIALNIPLLDPKNPQPGQAEVVINVLKLAEDKYGWNTIHPNAKSAIDMMDDILDDDDEGEDEEEEDVTVADEKANPLKKKEELTEEQLIKRHETKMNRKVGKYDYEDPFIDDAELQWEEEITTTKEGFFVYWGPLVEEKSASKKSTSKSKK